MGRCDGWGGGAMGGLSGMERECSDVNGQQK